MNEENITKIKVKVDTSELDMTIRKVKYLRKLLKEANSLTKELQAIWSNSESDMEITIDPKAVSQATHDSIQEVLRR